MYFNVKYVRNFRGKNSAVTSKLYLRNTYNTKNMTYDVRPIKLYNFPIISDIMA